MIRQRLSLCAFSQVRRNYILLFIWSELLNCAWLLLLAAQCKTNAALSWLYMILTIYDTDYPSARWWCTTKCTGMHIRYKTCGTLSALDKSGYWKHLLSTRSVLFPTRTMITSLPRSVLTSSIQRTVFRKDCLSASAAITRQKQPLLHEPRWEAWGCLTYLRHRIQRQQQRSLWYS